MLTFISLSALVFFWKVCGIMVITLASHTSAPGSIPVQPIIINFFSHSAAAIPSSNMCNLIFGVKRTFFFFQLSATKQAISIKLATTVGHFYMTLTLQTFIWLAQLVLIFLSPIF